MDDAPKGIIRYLLPGAAILSAFLFPWPFVLLLAVAAAIYVPPIALFIGILYDVLYYGTPYSFPVASVLGLVVSILAFFARRFIRARVTDFS
jgi:hypothetical protein